MRIVGAVLLVAGGLGTLGALWLDWAVDGPAPGHEPARDGWAWMSIGDVPLAVAGGVACVIGVALARRGSSALTGIVSLALVLGAVVLMGGVSLVWAAAEESFAVFDEEPHVYAAGPGPRVALAALTAVLAGAVVGALIRRPAGAA
jgi:hypothetical protein